MSDKHVWDVLREYPGIDLRHAVMIGIARQIEEMYSRPDKLDAPTHDADVDASDLKENSDEEA